MFAEPVPRRADDRLGVLVLRLPAEKLPGAARIGNERDRIPQPARADGYRDLLPRHLLRRRDDFLDRESPTRPEIAEDLPLLVELLHRADVRVRQVVDVD